MKLHPMLLLFLTGVQAGDPSGDQDIKPFDGGGGFILNCRRDLRIEELKGQIVLAGQCGPLHAIRLDGCIGNHEGKLVWQKEGGFSSNCGDCSLSINDSEYPVYMECKCKNAQGGETKTTVDLNEKIKFTAPTEPRNKGLSCTLDGEDYQPENDLMKAWHNSDYNSDR